MRFAASSALYFLLTISRNTRKAIAGSVVVPLLLITFTQISLPSQRATVSFSISGLMELPIKKICGVSLASRL